MTVQIYKRTEKVGVLLCKKGLIHGNLKGLSNATGNLSSAKPLKNRKLFGEAPLNKLSFRLREEIPRNIEFFLGKDTASFFKGEAN